MNKFQYHTTKTIFPFVYNVLKPVTQWQVQIKIRPPSTPSPTPNWPLKILWLTDDLRQSTPVYNHASLGRPAGCLSTIVVKRKYLAVLFSKTAVCLVFFPLSLCLARWFWPDLMNGKHTILLQFASLYDRQEVFVWFNCLLDLGTDFLVGNMVFVWDT